MDILFFYSNLNSEEFFVFTTLYITMDGVESCNFRGTCVVSVDSSKVQDPENARDLQPDSSGSVGSSTEDEKQEHNNTAAPSWDLVMENYSTQQQHWPSEGRHILAHFDDISVVVYQAFKDSIAEFAVRNQRFVTDASLCGIHSLSQLLGCVVCMVCHRC